VSGTPWRVFIARLAGVAVFDPNGDQVGRVRDVVVSLPGRSAPKVLGLLVEVPGNIGIDGSQHVESALHTHVDSPGVIHMEADKPFSATLGEFFDVWGLALGPDRIGGLKATKDRPLHVFVNGKPVSDPAAHVLKKNDNIVIAYGTLDGVPRIPDTTALDNANGTGRTPGPCSIGKGAKKRTKCFVDQK